MNHTCYCQANYSSLWLKVHDLVTSSVEVELFQIAFLRDGVIMTKDTTDDLGHVEWCLHWHCARDVHFVAQLVWGCRFN